MRTARGTKCPAISGLGILRCPVREFVTLKLPSALRNHLEVCAIAAAFEIGDQCFGTVVRGVGILGGVQHVEVFKTWTLMHCLPGFGAAGLVRAVVHDGDARMNRIHKRAASSTGSNRDGSQDRDRHADQIIGADERDFFGLGQVAQGRESETCRSAPGCPRSADSRSCRGPTSARWRSRDWARA